jgi:uncharacterized protein DUF3592
MAATTGLWRDGDFLVIDRDGFDVGKRCAFTNEPVGDAKHEVEISGPSDDLPPRARRIKLPMLVSPTWKGAAVEGKKRIGRWIFRIGAALLPLGIAPVVVISQYYPQGGQPQWVLGILVASSIVLALGLLAAVIGLAWPHLEGVPGPGGALEAGQIGRRYIFVRGAHLKYLSALPAWTGESRYKSAAAYERWVGIGMTVAGSFFLLAGLFFVVAGTRMRLLSAASANWPTAPGVIISSEVSESTIPTRRGVQTHYSASVRFKYAVAGSEYESQRVKYSGSPSSTDRIDADGIVSRYPAGQTVQVHYAPSDPSYGILEAGFDDNSTFGLVLGGGNLIVGVITLPLAIWLVRRTRKRAEQVASEVA